MSLLVCPLIVIPLARELLHDIGPSFRPHVFSRPPCDHSLEPLKPSHAHPVLGHFASFYCLVFILFATVLALFVSSHSTSFKANIIIAIIFVPYCLIPAFHRSILPDSYRPCPCTQHTHTLSLSLSSPPPLLCPCFPLWDHDLP